MHHPIGSKPAGRGGRRRGLIVLAVAALLVVPAAVSWACNPNAQLSPGKASYGPGETISISGSYFPTNTSMTVRGSWGASATATANQAGAFVVSIPGPSSPGNYTLTASRTDGNNASTGGLPKVASFQVATPTKAKAPASQPAPPTTRQGGDRSFVEPGVTRSPSRSVAGNGGNSGGGGGQPQGGGSTGGVAGGGTVVTGAPGAPVFAGSVAPSQASFGGTPAVAAQGTTAASPAKGAARSSGRAAAADSDVWSGFANGRTPSLTTDTAEAPDSGTGSSLGLGIGLLAVGLLALVAGLTAAEVRRRRAPSA